jgi:ankyrin repeat protein
MSQALIAAIERNDMVELQQHLEQGVNLNERDHRGRTAIMAATHANNPKIVKILIEAGADINLKDAMQDNPFLYAGAEGLLQILKLLIEAGADTKLTNRYGGNALIPAAEKGHVENVRELLSTTDVDVNHINNLGWTALLEVTILSKGGPKHQQITRLLIDNGANVNIADRDGVTPLQHAKRNGFTEIEQILMNARAQ